MINYNNNGVKKPIYLWFAYLYFFFYIYILNIGTTQYFDFIIDGVYYMIIMR